MRVAPFGDLFSADKGALPTFAAFPVPAAQATSKMVSFGVLRPELRHIMGWHLLLPFTLGSVL